ncbi:hypothetical protein SEA_SCHMIDT_66 [Gordonia phage Schmidt]|uniref:Uncharacterized protein n=1 Tax=Gordonia phage Schmidt TaxID=2301697 RepID=A0A385E0C0_9CAUD|nr:hypothetical protein KDJ59_gp66 [Gordonia phage Schmidt]AXQ65186.1 hypothetical protein SEA_SCHMIDT_66 [Gordonia phage Schmidt]
MAVNDDRQEPGQEPRLEFAVEELTQLAMEDSEPTRSLAREVLELREVVVATVHCNRAMAAVADRSVELSMRWQGQQIGKAFGL